jgi:hypothetical protein
MGSSIRQDPSAAGGRRCDPYGAVCCPSELPLVTTRATTLVRSGAAGSGTQSAPEKTSTEPDSTVRSLSTGSAPAAGAASRTASAAPAAVTAGFPLILMASSPRRWSRHPDDVTTPARGSAALREDPIRGRVAAG